MDVSTATSRFRNCIDKLELLVDSQQWDIPTILKTICRDLLSMPSIYARKIIQSEQFESLCGYMESFTSVASGNVCSTSFNPSSLLILCERVYGSGELPGGSLKEFVLYCCSDWELVPTWMTVNVKVSVVVDTLKRVWSEDPEQFVYHMLGKVGRRHLYFTRTDWDVDNFVRMIEALDSAPPDSELRVQSGSVAVDSLRLVDETNAMDDVMKNSFFLPQLLVCSVASSAGASELAVNVFCGGIATVLPRLQITPQQERDMFMTTLDCGLFSFERGCSLCAQVLRGVEYLRKHVKKLYGERVMVLYSCPTHPKIRIQHLFDSDATGVPGEWVDNVRRHLSGHPVYNRLLNLPENCLIEESRCLFHLISFNAELHADAWRCFADYCIRQKGKAAEFAHIVIPALSTRTVVSIPSARPESSLAYPPSSHKWMELCEELTNYTGSEWVYDVLTRSEVVCHDSPAHALAVALGDPPSGVDLKAHLLSLGFSKSLIDATWSDHQSILPHMTPDQVVNMIIERALHRMGMSERAPSVGGFPAQFSGCSANTLRGDQAPFVVLNDCHPGTTAAVDVTLEMLNTTLGTTGTSFKRLYHGTSWVSADSIVEGVNLDFSRVNLDFGKGFYTGESFSDAMNWADRFSQPAVVVFLIPSDEFVNPNPPLRILDLTSDHQRWSNLTEGCRGLNRTVMAEASRNECISGPIVQYSDH